MAADRKVEVEIKHSVVTAGAADRYLVAPELGPFRPVGQVRSIRVEDRYIDSESWAIARAGYAARLRKTSRGTAIGLKSLQVPGSRTHRRTELEGPATDSLAPSDWPASPARSTVLELCGGEPLAETLTLRQMRRVRRLEGEGCRAEMSLDEVEVVVEDRVLDRFEELEVELKQGPEAPLQALGDLLDRDPGLSHDPHSKLERASMAIDAALPTLSEERARRWRTVPRELLSIKPNGAGPAATEPGAPAPGSHGAGNHSGNHAANHRAALRAPGILADDTLLEAARKVMRSQFARLQAGAEAARKESGVDAVHDMRVASRRLRAAWHVFDDAFRSGKTKKLRRRVEALADRLGAVRDLDVLLAGLEEYRGKLDPDQQPGLDPLAQMWQQEREEARALMIEELDSPGHAGFVTAMDSFLAAGGSSAALVAAPTAPHRVRDRAPSQVWAAYEAVRAYELVLPWADLETLHQLRIAAKWLRYTIEFFDEALGSDCALLLERVVALQDHLGALHDADVSSKLARDVLVARAGKLSKLETDVIGAYLRSREREVARLRRALGPVWRAVAGAPFRRALGRATAAL
jgi:CHAD domain-containing protein